MSEKSLEDIVQEINTIIEGIDSQEEQKSAKSLIGTIIDTLSLNLEQLNEFKQNLLQDNSINESLKNYFMRLIDDRTQFLEAESMLPSQRKAKSFIELVNTENEEAREKLEYELKGKLTINNGPFELLDYGRDENGNLGIGLRMTRRTVSDQVIYISEEELEALFEKNNMDILSMFNEEIDRNRFSETTLRTLYLIDCFRDEGIAFEKEFYDLTNSHVHLQLEDGQDLESTDEYCELNQRGKGSDTIIIQEGEEPITISENVDSKAHFIFVEANESFPETIARVKNGTYHLKLDKKESEKTALEAESMEYDKLDELIDQREGKTGQNIGE